jgi:zinc/manganese transport system substrate-binding protein
LSYLTRFRCWAFWLLVLLSVASAACRQTGNLENDEPDVGSPSGELTLPGLAQVTDGDRPIQIVATTGIIGDVASNIAGEDAVVDVLIAPNQDPHGYQSKAGDLQLVAHADAVLVNGWRLEEGLIDDLQNAAGDVPIVPVSAGIKPRYFDGSGQANRVDPHVWLVPSNVIVWVDNIEYVLATLDPANSGSYAKRAEDYRSQLRDLDAYIQERLAPLGRSQRVLVTNHDAFGYFADAYGFTVVGTIIPGHSSLAEPASRELATLIERMREASVCAIFVEHSASQRLASQLATDLDYCDEVQIVALYSGAFGQRGSGADTYLTMMKTNIDMIVGALE